MSDERLKALLVHPHSATRGGTATFLRKLVEGLDQAGIVPVTAFLHSGGTLADEFRERSWEVRTVPAGRLRNTWQFAAAIRQLVSIIRREGVDVVFSNGAQEHLYGGIAARFAGRPAIWCSHVPWDAKYRLNRLVRSVPAAAVVANSQFNYGLLVAGGVRNLRLIPWGVPIPAVGRGVKQRAEKLLSVEGLTPPVIACIATLAELKGQRYLLEAFPAIRERCPGATLVFAGSPDAQADKNTASAASYADQLRAWTHEHGLDGSVRFLGFRPDVDVLLQAADLVVHPGIWPESFGFIIAEAMAAGRPVVASRLGAQQELIQEGRTGLLAEPGDATALAEACLAIVTDPDKAAAFGRAGRAHARRFLSDERMMASLAGLFRDVAAREPLSSPRPSLQATEPAA